MTVQAKRRIALGLGLLLTVWPAVHTVLVLRFDLNPWRFFGMSMYADTARRMQGREPIAVLSDGRTRTIQVDKVPPHLRPRLVEILQRFVAGRLTWGSFYRPESEAQALFVLMPKEAERAILSLDVFTLDDQARVQAETLGFRCRRAPLTCEPVDLRAALSVAP